MKKAEKEAIIAAGRKELRKWLEAAEKHGTIYYEITHTARSGMTRHIVLATIRMVKGKPVLWNLFPALPHEYYDGARATPWRDYSAALDIVAKDWGYSFKRRAFVIGGCGMDMVFALVDDLARKACMPLIRAKPPMACSVPRYDARSSYANRVRRESFS
jgi:hypothetical protein